MGVHGVWELLDPVGRVSVETLAGKKLAIDASIWMVQFMKAMRDERGEKVSLTQARIDMSELDDDSDGFLQPRVMEAYIRGLIPNFGTTSGRACSLCSNVLLHSCAQIFLLL